uniref:Fe2OG dioxygenase domain-containing protein n=1 Tax=Kalanchoe fedtschenkoi TaxID=63787 RepID=A0A7N0UFL3_KALFE
MEEEVAMSKFRIGSLPTLYYIPDFVTHDDQIHLLNHINQAPLAKWKTLKNRRLQNWGGVVHEKGLLSQNLPPWLSNLTRRISETTGLFPSPINHVLINEYLPDQGIMPHQDGPAYFPVVAILSLGSPAVMDFTPHSKLKLSDKSNSQSQDTCAEASEMEAQEWVENHYPFSVLLMPRSLLIFKDEAYSDYLHGIKDSRVQQFHGAVNLNDLLERHGLDQLLNSEKEVIETNAGDTKTICRSNTRISLTCRLVLKVHKNLFKI